MIAVAITPDLITAITTAVAVGVFPSAAAGFMLYKLTTSINGKLDRHNTTLAKVDGTLDRLGSAVAENTEATMTLSTKMRATPRRKAS